MSPDLGIKDPEATARANTLLAQGQDALRDDDADVAQQVVDQLGALQEELDREYEIRIVSRPGELSGVFRIPDANPNARNYYIVVEAVTGEGNILQRQIVNEEDGRAYQVSKWAVRVDIDTFEKIAADKKDDGIVQNNVFAVKKRGQLSPQYRFPTTGRAITSW